jgi:hypothetical protein
MSDRRLAGPGTGIVYAMLLAGSAEAQFNPPPCTGTIFNDVNCSGQFDAWIEQYAMDQITGGCGGGNYCPNGPVTRGQMAVFVEKAMRGTSQWTPGDVGLKNTALGVLALSSNTTGTFNTAIGANALDSQSFDNGGSLWQGGNTAIGVEALSTTNPSNVTNGIRNTAVGARAMTFNITGFENTALGYQSLVDNSGFRNTAVGAHAGARTDTITGYLGTNVTFVSNTTGNYNTFIGITGATTQVDNCTAVGIDAYCTANDQVRLGNFFVNSIGGKVDWSVISDARAKEDVQELATGLPLVLALRPVTYRYKSGNSRQNMGFVAQDVEEVLGNAYNVVDAGGDADRTLSLRYAQLIAPLVKAVQEQQAQIEALRAELTELKREKE